MGEMKLLTTLYTTLQEQRPRPHGPDDPDKPNWVVNPVAPKINIPYESSIKRLTEDNWDELVVNYGKPVLIMFTADWCPHCKKFTKALNALSPDSNFRVGIVNMTQQKSETPLAKKYGVQGIPKMKVYKNGKLRDIDLEFIRMAQFLGKDITDFTVKELRKEIEGK